MTNRPQTAGWVIAVLLAFIAGMLWSRSGSEPAALAQATPLAGARGIYAFPGQIDQTHHGLFMLDIEQGTLWCYELDEVDGERKLRLVAARSWIYDRYLRDYNGAMPDQRMVQGLVAAERNQQARTETDPRPAAAERSGDN
jgi:hypothetical protein